MSVGVMEDYKLRDLRTSHTLGWSWNWNTLKIERHGAVGGWWDLGHSSVRGVGSGSRDVDVWRENGSVRRRSGDPSTDDPRAWSRHLQLRHPTGLWPFQSFTTEIP
jgi:hypothetical protein